MKPPEALRDMRAHVYEIVLASMAVCLFYGFLTLVTQDPAPMIAGLIVTAFLWVGVGLGSIKGDSRAKAN